MRSACFGQLARKAVTVLVTAGCVSAVLFLTSIAIVVRGFAGQATLPVDCAVVFGAAVLGRDAPGAAIVRRVERAVDLYHADLVQTLFLTGGKGEGMRFSEAEVMQSLAERQDVAPFDIVRESRARSTWENLAFTRPLTSSCQTIVAISDRTHLARIKLLAARQGWGSLQATPATRLPPPRQEMRSILREALGYVYYALRVDRLWHIGPSAAKEKNI